MTITDRPRRRLVFLLAVTAFAAGGIGYRVLGGPGPDDSGAAAAAGGPRGAATAAAIFAPRQITTLREAGTSPRFTGDGGTLATLASAETGKTTVLAWNLADGTSSVRFAPVGATDLAVGPDDRLAVTNHRRGSALWDLAGNRTTIGAANGGGARSGDGATGGRAPVALLSKDTPLGTEGPYAFSPDGTTVTAVWSRLSTEPLLGVRSWDVASRARTSSIRLPGRPNAGPEGRNVMVGSLAHSPDGTSLAVGGSNLFRSTDGEGSAQVQFLDVAGQKVTGGLTSPPPEGGDAWENENTTVGSLAWSPDGRLLAVALEVNAASPVFAGVQLWDTRTRQLVTTVDETGGGTVAFSPDGTLLTYGGADGSTLHLWNVANRRHSHTIDLGRLPDGRPTYTGGQTFSPDGSRLAAPVGPDVTVWSLY